VRTGRAVSPVAATAEDPVLAIRGRDVAVTAAVLAVTAVAFAVVADHGLLAHIQHADDAWLRLMISGRAAPVTGFVRAAGRARGERAPAPLECGPARPFGPSARP
jgi:hypothetical protein